MKKRRAGRSGRPLLILALGAAIMGLATLVGAVGGAEAASLAVVFG